MSESIEFGARFRRNEYPYDYVFVTGSDEHSVGFRGAGGMGNMPRDEFEHTFTAAPKLERTANKKGPGR